MVGRRRGLGSGAGQQHSAGSRTPTCRHSSVLERPVCRAASQLRPRASKASRSSSRQTRRGRRSGRRPAARQSGRCSSAGSSLGGGSGRAKGAPTAFAVLGESGWVTTAAGACNADRHQPLGLTPARSASATPSARHAVEQERQQASRSGRLTRGKREEQDVEAARQRAGPHHAPHRQAQRKRLGRLRGKQDGRLTAMPSLRRLRDCNATPCPCHMAVPAPPPPPHCTSPTHPRQQVERQLHAPAALLHQYRQPRYPAGCAQHRPCGAARQVEAAARAAPLQEGCCGRVGRRVHSAKSSRPSSRTAQPHRSSTGDHAAASKAHVASPPACSRGRGRARSAQCPAPSCCGRAGVGRRQAAVEQLWTWSLFSKLAQGW